MNASPVTFVERGDARARPALEALAGRLRAAGRPARLLRSRDERGLYLLVIEGDAPPDDEDVRAARVWRFEAADA